jgi:hypothetical protein
MRSGSLVLSESGFLVLSRQLYLGCLRMNAKLGCLASPNGLFGLQSPGCREDQRERYKEEWQSHIDEIPGDICKIVIALGFVPASKMMSSETANKRPRIINAECHIGARVELRAAAIVRANSRGVLTVGIGTRL